MKDIRIINDVLEGQIDKYELIMDKYHPELFKYIYNLVGNYQDTEDLLQEVFLKIYNQLIRYDSTKASFRTWMYRITTNYIYNHLKSASNRLKQSQVVYVDQINQSDTDIEKKTIKSEQLEQIIEVIKSRLRPKHQKIMMLHYFSGLSVKEISETTDIPIKTIYKAIESSINKIKKEVTLQNEI